MIGGAQPITTVVADGEHPVSTITYGLEKRPSLLEKAQQSIALIRDQLQLQQAAPMQTASTQPTDPPTQPAAPSIFIFSHG